MRHVFQKHSLLWETISTLNLTWHDVYMMYICGVAGCVSRDCQPEVTFGFAGIPHEDVREGIEQEHSRRADSMIPFTTPNYHITTTSINEYAVVTNREKAQAASQGGSGGGRRIKFFLDVLEQEEAKKASLTEAEVVALILFTGPMVRVVTVTAFCLC